MDASQLLNFVEAAAVYLEGLLVHAGVMIDSITWPPLAASFVAGALALSIGARLSLAAAALLTIAWIAVEIAVISHVPDWIAPVAVVLFAVGLVQGLVTLLAGEEAAGDFLGVAFLGVILFLLWRGPGRIASLLLRRR